VHGYTPDVEEVINEARWVAETEIFHINVKVECLGELVKVEVG